MSDADSAGRLAAALAREAARRLETESLARLKRCLSLLSEQEVWHRPNRELVSVGNLVLHLCGNVRQWVISGLGGEPDRRTRDAEFSEKGPLPTGELIERIEQTMREALAVIRRLTPEALLTEYRVQGFRESGLGVIVHVIEHFSWHVGQITYFTKLRREADTGFYAGVDLGVTE